MILYFPVYFSTILDLRQSHWSTGCCSPQLWVHFWAQQVGSVQTGVSGAASPWLLHLHVDRREEMQKQKLDFGHFGQGGGGTFCLSAVPLRPINTGLIQEAAKHSFEASHSCCIRQKQGAGSIDSATVLFGLVLSSSPLPEPPQKIWEVRIGQNWLLSLGQRGIGRPGYFLENLIGVVASVI